MPRGFIVRGPRIYREVPMPHSVPAGFALSGQARAASHRFHHRAADALRRSADRLRVHDGRIDRRPNVLHRVEARQRDPRCFRIDAACATCAASVEVRLGWVPEVRSGEGDLPTISFRREGSQNQGDPRRQIGPLHSSPLRRTTLDQVAAQRWPGQPYFRQIAADARGGRSRQPNVQTAMRAACGSFPIWVKVMVDSLRLAGPSKAILSDDRWSRICGTVRQSV